ncbi:MAG: heavy-metal-associated domain-containing protein [Nitrospirae bacterium]|nr:heavy-metal-associated domain-containing protein [Nitrospirota bacterium]
MKKLLLSVEKDYCSECSLALTRFIGNMDGIDSLGIENGSIAIVFDESKISAATLVEIAEENIRRFGYSLLNADVNNI